MRRRVLRTEARRARVPRAAPTAPATELLAAARRQAGSRRHSVIRARPASAAAGFSRPLQAPVNGLHPVPALPGPPPSPSLPALRQAIVGGLLAPLILPACRPHRQRRRGLPSDLKLPRSCQEAIPARPEMIAPFVQLVGAARRPIRSSAILMRVGQRTMPRLSKAEDSIGTRRTKRHVAPRRVRRPVVGDEPVGRNVGHFRLQRSAEPLITQ